MPKHLWIVIISLVFALPLAAQNVPVANNGAAPTQAPGQVISVLSPQPGARLNQDFVTVKYAVTTPTATAAEQPTFELRLDSRSPVTTTFESHTFGGLAPGPHTITVELVDANGVPVRGGKAVVHFSVAREP